MNPVKISSSQLEIPRFVEGKPFLVAGMQERYTPQTMNKIPAQWERMVPYLGNIPGQVGRIAYGVIRNMTKDVAGFDYLSGVEVSSLKGIPQEFSSVSIPGQMYAVFTHRAHVSKLKDTMDAIWNKWMPLSNHAAGDGTDTPCAIERYGESFDPQSGTGDIEVWVPIKS